MKRSYYLFVLLTYLVFQPILAPGSGVIAYHEGFEFGTSLEENGYEIDNIKDPDMIAESDRNAASTGARGLLMVSEILEGATKIRKAVNVEYDIDLFFSFHVKIMSGLTNMRIEMIDENGNLLYLDYGTAGDSWENDFIYDVAQPFNATGEWLIINRKVDTDIKTALNHQNATYTEFLPTMITFVEIFQNDVASINEGHVDEILINPFGNRLFSVRTESVSIASFPVIPMILGVVGVYYILRLKYFTRMKK